MKRKTTKKRVSKSVIYILFSPWTDACSSKLISLALQIFTRSRCPDHGASHVVIVTLLRCHELSEKVRALVSVQLTSPNKTVSREKLGAAYFVASDVQN